MSDETGMTLEEVGLVLRTAIVTSQAGGWKGVEDGLRRVLDAITQGRLVMQEDQPDKSPTWRSMSSAPRDRAVLLLVDGVAHQGRFTGPSDGSIYAKTSSVYNWFSETGQCSLHDDVVTKWCDLPGFG